MSRSVDSPAYRSMSTALVRAVAHPAVELPPWPDLTEPRPDLVPSWVSWLRQVWAIDAVAEAVTLSSPVLAEQVSKLRAGEAASVRETRRTVHAVVRYVQRLLGRPTPFGLLAGVAPAMFGSRAPTRWGSAHQAIARASAGWLADLIVHLERCPELLSRLAVVANSTLTVRDDRLIVPYQAHPGVNGQLGAAEVSLRHSAPVRAAIAAARSPIRVEVLAAQLRGAFPQAPAAVVMAMLTQLIAHRALITSLHAPSTEPDALAYLLRQLDDAGAEAGTPDRFEVLVRRAGLPLIRLHDTRHTCGTLTHLRNVPAAVISAWLGHANVAFTMKTYVHSQDEALKPREARSARCTALRRRRRQRTTRSRTT